MNIHALPLTYRADLLKMIYVHLQAGKCGALYGVASCGKSRLVEFMGRPDVRQHYQQYFGGDWTKTLFPWVDGNDLLEYDEWGLCEKILSAIIADLGRLPDHGGAAQQTAQEWYWKLVQPENRKLARRLLTYALDDLAGYHVALLLDDLDEFIKQADEGIYRGLRGLRDHFKHDNQYRLLYLLIARRQLTDLHGEEEPAFESFLELFKNFSHPIGCYNHDDALFMIRRLADAYQLPGRAFTNEVAEQLIDVTGGHAGLIDASFHSGTEAEWTRLGLARALMSSAGVWNECVSIYESLTTENRATIIEVAIGNDPGVAATRFLEDAGLVRRGFSRTPRTVELLHLFLADPDQLGPHLRLYPERRSIGVDTHTIELTEREFLVVQFLYQRRGQDCSYFDLHEALHSMAPFNDVTREEMGKLLHRLDNKISGGSRLRILIHTPGRACRLVGFEGR